MRALVIAILLLPSVSRATPAGGTVIGRLVIVKDGKPITVPDDQPAYVYLVELHPSRRKTRPGDDVSECRMIRIFAGAMIRQGYTGSGSSSRARDHGWHADKTDHLKRRETNASLWRNGNVKAPDVLSGSSRGCVSCSRIGLSESRFAASVHVYRAFAEPMARLMTGRIKRLGAPRSA